ncbi:hypothetical protein M758_6G058400 [Ceratodon purpureus]|nr:hypothetical protein M758_6G058400 [Ceratodon purpureus]
MSGTSGVIEPLFQVPSFLRDEVMASPVRRSLIPKEAIQHLLEIRGLPDSDFWKVAEEEWEKIEQKFAGRVATSRGQILNVSNEIYQVVGFSAAFQGLLLAAVSQGSQLNCNSRWWALVLSIFGTQAATTAVWEKNRIITWLQESLEKDERTRETYAVRLRFLHELGPRSFDFDRLVESEAGVPRKPPSSLQRVVLKVAILLWPPYRYRVLSCVIQLGLLCGLAIQYILCDNLV